MLIIYECFPLLNITISFNLKNMCAMEMIFSLVTYGSRKKLPKLGSIRIFPSLNFGTQTIEMKQTNTWLDLISIPIHA